MKKAVYFELKFVHVLALPFYNNFCDATELSKGPNKPTHFDLFSSTSATLYNDSLLNKKTRAVNYLSAKSVVFN